jgi:hypothetical protein
MKRMLAGTFLAGALTVAVPRVEAGELSTLLDLSLRFSERGFTLDARVDGPHGPTTGSVKGQLRDDGGMGLNGWVDDRGKVWLFELDADEREGLRAIIRRSQPPRI